MVTKYVLWRVSNGWLMTIGNTIWEDWERRSTSAVFHSLKEFSDWVEKQDPASKHQQPRSHGKKSAVKPKPPINRIAEHAGRTIARH